MLPPLTENQLILLNAVVAAGQPMTLEALAAVRKSTGDEFGENAARNAMKRMEERGLVVGSGPGRKRKIALTAYGEQERKDASPVPDPQDPPAPAENGSSDSSSRPGWRTYTMLEELDVYELVRQYVPDEALPVLEKLKPELQGKTAYEVITRAVAPNADNALRATGKEIFAQLGGKPDEDPRVIAVPRFRVEPLEIGDDGRVRLGGRS